MRKNRIIARIVAMMVIFTMVQSNFAPLLILAGETEDYHYSAAGADAETGGDFEEYFEYSVYDEYDEYDSSMVGGVEKEPNEDGNEAEDGNYYEEVYDEEYEEEYDELAIVRTTFITAPVVVTFNANGGNTIPGHGMRELGEYETTLGTNMPDVPWHSSYAFWHWNTARDGSGVPFTANSEVDSDITVYAQWGFDVHFLPGTTFPVTGDFESIVVGPGMSAAASGTNWPTEPTRTNFAFRGWDTSPAGERPIDSDYWKFDQNTTIPMAGLTLYARWYTPPRHTITFVAGEHGQINGTATRDFYNGHTVANSYRGIPTGTGANMVPTIARLNQGITPDRWGAAAPPATRPGATLEGWWTSSDGWENITNPHTGTNNISGAAPGRWAHLGAAAGTPSASNPMPVPSFPSVNAAGIRTGAINTAPLPAWNSPEAALRDLTVYANWVYRVTFDVNGGNQLLAIDRWRDFPAGGDWLASQGRYFLPGNDINPANGRWGIGIPTPSHPNGLRFEGWFTPDGTRFDDTFQPDGNLTVSARWTARPGVYFGVRTPNTQAYPPFVNLANIYNAQGASIATNNLVSAFNVTTGQSLNSSGARVEQGNTIRFTFAPNVYVTQLHRFAGWHVNGTLRTDLSIDNAVYVTAGDANINVFAVLNPLPWHNVVFGITDQTVNPRTSSPIASVSAVATLPCGTVRSIVTGTRMPESTDVVFTVNVYPGHDLQHVGWSYNNGSFEDNPPVRDFSASVTDRELRVFAVFRTPLMVTVTFDTVPTWLGEVTAATADGTTVLSGQEVPFDTVIYFELNTPYDLGSLENFYGWTIATEIDNNGNPIRVAQTYGADDIIRLEITRPTEVLAWFELNPYVNILGGPRPLRGQVTFRANPPSVANAGIYVSAEANTNRRDNFPDANWFDITSPWIALAGSEVRFDLNGYPMLGENPRYRLTDWTILRTRNHHSIYEGHSVAECPDFPVETLPANYPTPFTRTLALSPAGPQGRLWNSNLDVTANFERILFDISYSIVPESGGEVMRDGPLTNLAVGTTRTLAAQPDTAAGYVFVGWYADGVRLQTEKEIELAITGHDIVLEARFENLNRGLTVQINGGGTPDPDNPLAVTVGGSTVTRSTAIFAQGDFATVVLETLSPSHTFTRWDVTPASARGSYGVNAYGQQFITVRAGAEDVTVNAVLGVATHTVVFHANGGTWSPVGSSQLNAWHHPTGTNAAAIANQALRNSSIQTRTTTTGVMTTVAGTTSTGAGVANGMPRAINNPPAGMVFAGWYEREGSPANGFGDFIEGTRFAAGSPVTRDMHLHARWADARFVTFEGNGNTGGGALFNNFRVLLPIADGLDMQQMHDIWNVSFASNTSTTEINVTFNNQRYNLAGTWTVTRTGANSPTIANGRWNTSQFGLNGGRLFDQNFAVTQDMTVYAQWLANITFNSNKSSVDIPGVNLSDATLVFSNTAANNNAGRPQLAIGRSFADSGSHPATHANAPLFPTSDRRPADVGAADWPFYHWRALSEGMEIIQGEARWVLAGWNTARDGTGQWFNRYSPTGVNGLETPLTLFAIWRQQVVFDSGSAPAHVIEPANRLRDIPAPINGVAQPLADFPPDPVWEDGSDFLRWSFHPGGGPFSTVNRDTPFRQPTVVFAIWNVTLTFDANGDGASLLRPQHSQFTTQSNVALSGIPFNLVGGATKPGYRFLGWSPQADAAEPNFGPGSSISQSKTVFAVWEEIEVTANQVIVHFNPNGGDMVCDTEYVRVYEGDYLGEDKPENPTRDGHTFTGWRWYYDGEVVSYLIYSTPVNYTKTVFAQWTANALTVTFDGNQGTVAPENATRTVSHGNALGANMPDAEPVRAGWRFLGWNTMANGTGDVFDHTSVVRYNDITVYAQWERIVLTVTFVANNGAWADDSTSTTRQVNHGEAVGAAMPTIPSLAGNEFVEWNRQQDGYGAEFTDTTPVTESITVYAQWVPNEYTVRFRGNGGNLEPGGRFRKVDFGTSLDEDRMPGNPERDGHDFMGWNTARNGTGDDFAYDTVVLGNKTVFAQWYHRTYRVTFDPNGGNLAPGGEYRDALHGSTLGYDMPDDPDHGAHNFLGWKDIEGNPFDSTTPVTGNITVYAQWEQIHTVRFFTYGGVEHASVSVVHGGQVGQPADPAKDGYTFAGWHDAIHAADVDFDFAQQIIRNHDVIARWVPIPVFHNVTFIYGNGSPDRTEQVAHGGTVAQPANPTRADFSFVQWVEQGTAVTFDFNTLITQDWYLTAQWQPVTTGDPGPDGPDEPTTDPPPPVPNEPDEETEQPAEEPGLPQGAPGLPQQGPGLPQQAPGFPQQGPSLSGGGRHGFTTSIIGQGFLDRTEGETYAGDVVAITATPAAGWFFQGFEVIFTPDYAVDSPYLVDSPYPVDSPYFGFEGTFNYVINGNVVTFTAGEGYVHIIAIFTDVAPGAPHQGPGMPLQSAGSPGESENPLTGDGMDIRLLAGSFTGFVLSALTVIFAVRRRKILSN